MGETGTETGTETGPKPDRNRTGKPKPGNRDSLGPKPGRKPGQPQLTPWAAGIFPGLHYTTAGNIPLTLARLVASWSAPLGARPPLTVERGLGWGKKSAVPTADPTRRPHSHDLSPKTPSPQSEISNSRAISEIVLP